MAFAAACFDGVWIKPTAEQAQWFNEGVDTAREIIIKLESKLATVTAERDALRRAAELGLEYAETELQHRKKVYDGYPSRWELDEIYVGEIKAALRGEVQGE
jgi:hypothetical protein